MSNWIGFAVSVTCCEPLGCYQGTILEADGTTITLTKAFRNGFPYPKSQVTLNAADIKDLRIIEESHPEPSEQTHSTVAISKNNKKVQRATVCENLQANPSHSVAGNQSSMPSSNTNKTSLRGLQVPTVRSKPIDIQGPQTKNNVHSGSFGNSGLTPKGRGGPPQHEKARRRNEACFGDAAEPAVDDDFDFEGNLALFDKQALWEEMRCAARPDVVRAADEAARFRHDENVLGGARAGGDDILMPDELRGPLVYTTDDGRRVPSASARLRRELWRALRRGGLADSALTLLARAAADVALRLAGGGRRLEARNAHQAPVAVALVGAHETGATGACAARLLAAHGARAYVLLAAPPAAASTCAPLRRELTALAAAGGTVHARADRLPPPDVVLLALHEPADGEAAEGAEAEATGELGAALAWARGARAALLALEPPAAGYRGLGARAALVAGLPAALAPSLGRVFLANVAPPPRLLRELGVEYRPPFGASSVLPLN